VQPLIRVGRAVAGFTLIVAGVLMIALPGPGWASIALGLAILAPDFPWARRALDRLKHESSRGATAARSWWRRLRTGSSTAGDDRAG